MRLINRKKRKSERQSRSVERHSSAPIVRYYRPAPQDSSLNKARSQNIDREEQSKNKGSISVINLFIRWSGFIIIGLLLVLNTTIGDVSISAKIPEGWPITADNYKSGIKSILNESVWNRSKATMSSSRFEQKIKQKFPEVESATAIVPLAGRRLQVNLTFAEPIARVITTNNEQALMSKNGIVMLKQDATKINSSFSFLPALSIPSLPINVSEQIMTQEEVMLVSLLTAEFDGSQDARPKLRTIEFDAKKREMKIRFDGKNYYAKLTSDREPRLQVGSLVATLVNSAEQGIVISEYVDVRVDGRVFIK